MELQTLISCDSKNVIYILKFHTCEWFYRRQTDNSKQRVKMFFIPKLVFVRNAQEIYAILAE